LLDGGYIEVDELEPATPQALVDALQTRPRPDVLHYYGHGRYAAGQGALLLDAPDAAGGAWVAADALMALLGGVRMVALFACQGAAVGGAPASDVLAGVAPALSAAGVPLVMGMQFAVRVRAATRASGVMYRALVAGWSVQQAVALARQALYVEEPDRASWYVPVLYVRAHEPAAAYLLAPPQRATREAGATLPRQSIRAGGGSHVRGVAMQSDGSAAQAVDASRASRIEQARLRAVGRGEQRLRADDASTIRDVELGHGDT
jgi:hypothetical protein